MVSSSWIVLAACLTVVCICDLTQMSEHCLSRVLSVDPKAAYKE